MASASVPSVHSEVIFSQNLNELFFQQFKEEENRLTLVERFFWGGFVFDVASEIRRGSFVCPFGVFSFNTFRS
jgi:hypothetical protein